jgi:DNA-binding transcriptional ArsR family regulator
VSEENEDINSEPEICEVFTYDEEKVERLKKEVAVTEGLSTFFKALADDTRLKVIHALSQDELCVCDVANILGSTVQAASHHLRVLRNIGLAKYRKEGKRVFYSIRDRKTAGFIQKVIEDLKKKGI